MEFVAVLEAVQPYLSVDNIMTGGIAVFLILVFALLTCFLGYRLHNVLIVLSFSVIGYFLGSFFGVLFTESNMHIYVYIFVSVMIGVLAGVFSHKLHGLFLLLFNAAFCFVAVFNFLTDVVPATTGMAAGFVSGIVLGCLSVRFPYIVTAGITAFGGAVISVSFILNFYGIETPYLKLGLTAFFFAAGFAVQAIVESVKRRKEKLNEEFVTDGSDNEEYDADEKWMFTNHPNE